MRILLVNDDGIDARPAYGRFYDEFCNEHEVIVCAPSLQRSGSIQSRWAER